MSRISRIATDVKYSLVQFLRNKQSVFFAIVFPVIFLVVLGYLLGGQSGPATLYYVDGDGSQASRAFIGSLSYADSLDLKDGSGMDLPGALRDGKISAYIEIPPGFRESVSDNASGIGLKIYFDKSRASYPAIVSAVQQAVDKFNMDMAGTKGPVTLSSQDVATSSMNYIDFLLPGILGMCIMFSALNETIGIIVKYRANGVFNMLSVTPMSTIEWNLARIISGTLIVLVSVAFALGVAWLAFGVVPAMNILSVLLVLAGSVMFVGMGMIVAYLVEDVGSPNAVSLIITLPLMMVSGSLFPIDQLPYVIRFFSVLSPLTPLNNGLRSAMFTGGYDDALVSLLIIAGLGFVLFTIGVAVLMGKEGQDV
jgi:ABC-2 type transport system permease protein